MNDPNEFLSPHEKRQTREIVERLRRDLHAPPPWLDARMREMIGGRVHASAFRPFMAFGLSSAAFLALLAGLASALADTPMAEWGPGVAVGISIGYLAISAAAALPLLIEHRPRFVGRKVHA